MAEIFSDIPEAETCSQQLQHKEYSENMLGKENLVMKKEQQALEEFNIASKNRMTYRSFSDKLWL